MIASSLTRTHRGTEDTEESTSARARTRRTLFLCVLCYLCVLCARDAHAQLRRPRAEVVPLVERPAARAGERVRVALKVSLPEGLHTQSNKPRDPLLIPTELAIEAPAGIAAEEIVWPPSTDLAQAGQEKPLAVFEHEFVVGVELSIAPTASGDVEVPAKLRYQACDANLCYPPQTAPVTWRIHVVPAAAAAPPSDAAVASTFASIKFGRGEKPGAGGSEAYKAWFAASLWMRYSLPTLRLPKVVD